MIAGQTSLFFKESLTAMSKFLGTQNDIDSVLKKRNERASDLRAYAGDLYEDAGLKLLILSDYRFRSTVGSPIQTKNKLVIHILMFSVLDKFPSFDEAINEFENSLNDYVRNKGFIGMKSMIDLWWYQEGNWAGHWQPERVSRKAGVRRLQSIKGENRSEPQNKELGGFLYPQSH